MLHLDFCQYRDSTDSRVKTIAPNFSEIQPEIRFLETFVAHAGKI
jgi:hypothetical protein